MPDPAAPDKPWFVYDGGCDFCRFWVARWRIRVAGRVIFMPAREAAPRFPQIPVEELERSAKWVEPRGNYYSGAKAVFRLLREAGGGAGFWWWFYNKSSAFARIAEAVYVFIAGRRPIFSRLTRWFWGRNPEPPSRVLVSHVFLRALAAVYVCAFASLWSQIDGLIGSGGILPVRLQLESAPAYAAAHGMSPGWAFPTLCWLSPSDGFLHFQCAAGTFLAAVACVAPFCAWVWLLLWALYLSLVTAGNVFMGFQWDSLLLETGFLAAFLAPLTLFPRWRNRAEPPGSVVGLFEWLLFRLMFASGVVKLAWTWWWPYGGVPPANAWSDGSAMLFHYWTQPLPPWTAWYANRLPEGFQRFSVDAVLWIEIAVPFLFFAPRRLRLLGCALQAGLQLLILLTGNYCFFNLLTLALCLWLLDDHAWPLTWLRRLGARLPGAGAALAAAPALRPWPGWVLAPLSGVLIVAGGCLLVFDSLHVQRTAWARTHAEDGWRRGLDKLTTRGLTHLHVVNSYGLFRQMTTDRPEIIVEGSDDGETWKPYEFPYKPGDLARAPRFNIPHQPRLDWQMWFAALSPLRYDVVLENLCIRIEQGSPAVLGLLESNPFPDVPPMRLRMMVYHYRFTTAEERARTGRWWTREEKGRYLAVYAKQDLEAMARARGMGR